MRIPAQLRVKSVLAREVLDSRGFPTIEVDLIAGDSNAGRAIVPSGASTGEGEALELRDGDAARYQGKGVLNAVKHVNEVIAPAIRGKFFSDMEALDRTLCELDGTENKSKLGANAILGVSMAFARARSSAYRTPTHTLLAEASNRTGGVLPVPLMNVVNGGKHADNGLAIQEFMIVPAGFSSFKEALRAGAEVFHTLKKILHSEGLSTGVGDEGGFAPSLPAKDAHETLLKKLMHAIEKAGYKPGEDIFLALDSAASEFSKKSEKGDGYDYLFEGKTISSDDLVSLYAKWSEKYPIVSIEDGLGEHDWAGWKALTEKLGSRIQLVGDDLFCTNEKVLQKGIDAGVANSILIKLNQIGTVSETLRTMNLARSANYSQIASHRSGETEDTFIADLAVGTETGQIKTGSASRTDRIAKYNQLLRIEEMLGAKGSFAGKAAFRLNSN
jgi:enolase